MTVDLIKHNFGSVDPPAYEALNRHGGDDLIS